MSDEREKAWQTWAQSLDAVTARRINTMRTGFEAGFAAAEAARDAAEASLTTARDLLAGSDRANERLQAEVASLTAERDAAVEKAKEYRQIGENWRHGLAQAESERDAAEANLDTARGFIGRFMAGEDVRVEAAQFCAALDAALSRVEGDKDG